MLCIDHAWVRNGMESVLYWSCMSQEWVPPIHYPQAMNTWKCQRNACILLWNLYWFIPSYCFVFLLLGSEGTDSPSTSYTTTFSSYLYLFQFFLKIHTYYIDCILVNSGLAYTLGSEQAKGINRSTMTMAFGEIFTSKWHVDSCDPIWSAYLVCVGAHVHACICVRYVYYN